MTRGERLALAAIVGAGIALRAPLGLQSLWFDEGQTVDVLHRGLGGVLTSAVPDTQNFPPLYFALAWLWTRVFGSGDVGLRSLSAVCGVLTIAAAYWAGSVLAARRVGLALAALAATSPLLVWYSQEARPYALLVALSTLSLALFGRARERPDAGRLVAWAACCAAALATHYFAVFVVAPEAALLLLAHRRARAALGAVAGLAAVGAALLPLALHQRASGRGESIATSPLADRARTLPNRFLLGEQGDPSGDYGRVHLLLYALAPLALAGLWWAWRRSEGRARSAALAGLVVGGCGVAVPLALAVVGEDYVVDRNLLAAWAGLALLLACGLAASRAGLAVLALIAALSAAVVVAVDATPRLRRDDWRAVARQLCVPHPARALVVTPFHSLPALRRYLPDVRPLGPRPGGLPEAVVIAIRGPAGRPQVVHLQAHDDAPQALAALALPSAGARSRPLLLAEPGAATARWSSRCVL